MSLERYRTDIVAFCDDLLGRTELGRPFRPISKFCDLSLLTLLWGTRIIFLEEELDNFFQQLPGVSPKEALENNLARRRE